MSDKLLVALRPTNTRREVADAFVGVAVSSEKVELKKSIVKNKSMLDLTKGMPGTTPHCYVVRMPDGSEKVESFDSTLSLSAGTEVMLDGQKVIVDRITPEECIPLRVWKK